MLLVRYSNSRVDRDRLEVEIIENLREIEIYLFVKKYLLNQLKFVTHKKTFTFNLFFISKVLLMLHFLTFES